MLLCHPGEQPEKQCYSSGGKNGGKSCRDENCRIGIFHLKVGMCNSHKDCSAVGKRIQSCCGKSCNSVHNVRGKSFCLKDRSYDGKNYGLTGGGTAGEHAEERNGNYAEQKRVCFDSEYCVNDILESGHFLNTGSESENRTDASDRSESGKEAFVDVSFDFLFFHAGIEQNQGKNRGNKGAEDDVYFKNVEQNEENNKRNKRNPESRDLFIGNGNAVFRSVCKVFSVCFGFADHFIEDYHHYDNFNNDADDSGNKPSGGTCFKNLAGNHIGGLRSTRAAESKGAASAKDNARSKALRNIAFFKNSKTNGINGDNYYCSVDSAIADYCGSKNYNKDSHYLFFLFGTAVFKECVAKSGGYGRSRAAHRIYFCHYGTEHEHSEKACENRTDSAYIGSCNSFRKGKSRTDYYRNRNKKACQINGPVFICNVYEYRKAEDYTQDLHKITNLLLF